MRTFKKLAAIIGLALVAAVFADQGPPVYTATGSKPTQGAVCGNAPRVQIDNATGKLWCCVSAQWDACGSVASAATATALAANGSNCSAGYAAGGVSATGAAESCVQVTPPGELGRVQTYSVGTLAANGWYTIANMPAGARGYAQFIVVDPTSGKHSVTHFTAIANYGQIKLVHHSGDRYSTETIAGVRALYTTADRTYGEVKLQILISNQPSSPTVHMLYDQFSGFTNWVAVTPAVLEDAPLGFTEDATTKLLAPTGDPAPVPLGITGPLYGNATTATALAADPADCTGNSWAKGIAASGAAACAQPSFSNLSGTASVAQGGTGNASAIDDYLLVGNGTTWQGKPMPSCFAPGSKIAYDAGLNQFSCQTSITANGLACPGQCVSSAAIEDGAITTGKIDAYAITSNLIASNQITSDHIAAGQITAGHIAAGAITAEKIAARTITASSIYTNYGDMLWPNGSSEVEPPAFASADVLASAEFANRTTGDAYSGFKKREVTRAALPSQGTVRLSTEIIGASAGETYSMTAYVKRAAGVDPQDHVGLEITFHLGTGGSVAMQAHTTSGTYTPIVNRYTAPAGATGVQFSLIAYSFLGNAVTGHFDEVVAKRIANATDLNMNAVTAEAIYPGVVSTDKLADVSVTEAKLGAASVTSTKIADSNVTTSKIADSNVTEAKLGTGAVTETKLGANAVSTAKIANNAVTLAKLEDSGWINATLNANYANVGGSYSPTRYRKIAGVVYLEIATTRTTAATSPFTLPAGFRPSGTLIFSGWHSASPMLGYVHSNGVVEYYGSVQNGQVALFSFPADQ